MYAAHVLLFQLQSLSLGILFEVPTAVRFWKAVLGTKAFLANALDGLVNKVKFFFALFMGTADFSSEKVSGGGNG